MNALDALERARQAWERTQPQLTIPGVLEETDTTGVSVSPSPPIPSPLRRARGTAAPNQDTTHTAADGACPSCPHTHRHSPVFRVGVGAANYQHEGTRLTPAEG